MVTSSGGLSAEGLAAKRGEENAAVVLQVYRGEGPHERATNRASRMLPRLAATRLGSAPSKALFLPFSISLHLFPSVSADANNHVHLS
jgi:hypothetical protein